MRARSEYEQAYYLQILSLARRSFNIQSVNMIYDAEPIESEWLREMLRNQGIPIYYELETNLEGNTADSDHWIRQWAARCNQCVELAFSRGERLTHLIWIEADLCYPYDTIEILLSRNKPIIAPLVYLNNIFYDTLAFRDTAGANIHSFEPVRPTSDKAVIELGSVGSFVVCKTKVFRSGIRFRGKHENGLWVGICEDAAKIGLKSFADTTISILHPVSAWQKQVWRCKRVQLFIDGVPIPDLQTSEEFFAAPYQEVVRPWFDRHALPCIVMGEGQMSIKRNPSKRTFEIRFDWQDQIWRCQKVQLFADGIHIQDLPVPPDTVFGGPFEELVHPWLDPLLRPYAMGDEQVSIVRDASARTFEIRVDWRDQQWRCQRVQLFAGGIRVQDVPATPDIAFGGPFEELVRPWLNQLLQPYVRGEGSDVSFARDASEHTFEIRVDSWRCQKVQLFTDGIHVHDVPVPPDALFASPSEELVRPWLNQLLQPYVRGEGSDVSIARDASEHTFEIRVDSWRCQKVQLFTDGIHVRDVPVPPDVLFASPSEELVRPWLNQFLQPYVLGEVLGDRPVSIARDASAHVFEVSVNTWRCRKMQLFADGIHVRDLQVPPDILFGAPNETAVYVYLWLSRFLRLYYNVMGSARLSVRPDPGGRQTFDIRLDFEPFRIILREPKRLLRAIKRRMLSF